MRLFLAVILVVISNMAAVLSQASAGDKPSAAAVQPTAAHPTATVAAGTQPTSQDTSGLSVAPDAKTARAEYDKVFAQWKQLLGQLRDIRQQFADTPPESEDLRREIANDFVKLLVEGDALVIRLTLAAESAYTAENGKDAELEKFLTNQAYDAAARDDDETTARLCRLLLTYGPKRRSLLQLGGVASMNINDYETAKQYLQQAASAGELKNDVMLAAQSLLAQEALWQREKKLREAEAKADDLPRVKLETQAGEIVIELFENEAPNTVANFISLVNQGFYDGLHFHRVVNHFVAQAGGNAGPGYRIPGEAKDDKSYRRHFRGSVSMALPEGGGADDGSSEFFITYAGTPGLDGKHTVFGRVISGMDVVAKLSRGERAKDRSFLGDSIIKATVVRKRDHKYEPQRLPELPGPSAM